MFNPVATYRIQFHKDFTFSDLDEQLPYLHELGIQTIYASPVFTATPGSTHGYDVADPLTINPEIGTLQELRRLSKKLKALGISWLQDIVPNHMAFHPGNPWLMDVLKNGERSEYASFFDVDWSQGPLMVPFQGSSIEKDFPQPAKYYELCSGAETSTRINYRRFFTVNELICLNMQREEVFVSYHQLIKQLVEEGIFQGLRVDHIDGLYDPDEYLKRLRDLAGPQTYIIVEKILEQGESFPGDWPVQGNTGYDFLALVNNVFTCPGAKKKFSDYYRQLDSIRVPVGILQKKRLILERFFQGDLDNLCRLWPEASKEAIAKLLIDCPVYRYYKFPGKAFFDLIPKALSSFKSALKKGDEQAWHFYRRLMQLTGPLMAKGVEDTLMYTYDRFIGHNEVGDSPAAFGLSVADFHVQMLERQERWPLSLNATATHDTKRGEDVRARLNALTNFPEEWFTQVNQWHAPASIAANDVYLVEQTLVGAHPMPGQGDDNFKARLNAYLEKALREGKQHSDWVTPDEHYERAIKSWSSHIKLDRDFFRKITDQGIIISLAQMLLKFTCPGIPDIYQGTEFWDLSLVDPDNRRPVAYSAHQKLLMGKNDDWETLWEHRDNGAIKAKLAQRLLHVRKKFSLLFDKGVYIPLKTKGQQARDILAFARQHGESWLITIVPLRLAADWGDTVVTLPDYAPGAWKNLLNNEEGYTEEGVSVQSLFKTLPLALLQLEAPRKRRSGLLLHVTSLPSGTIGSDAFRFIDFLNAAGQRYWQMLPLNTVDRTAGNSPYSSTSSMAGNTLLIDQDDHTLFSDEEFEAFKAKEAFWLDDFALYSALKTANRDQPWHQWPDSIKFRETASLAKAMKAHSAGIDEEKRLQFIFSLQWRKLKGYAESKGIKLLGDLPFYVSYDSADVWAQPELFQLDQQAGVPPDYFSAEGQLWGMPVYNWAAMKANGYTWWLNRIRKNLEYFDEIRLDHFRAFAAYWSVPAGEVTAVKGRWIKGPGADFFKQVKKELGRLPFVAEDLGDIDASVDLLRDQFGLPGMRVLQFAFSEEMPLSPHIPHNFSPNSFAYTGTHDNNTLMGWYHEDTDQSTRKRIKRYAGGVERLIPMLLASAAETVILPVQDLLGLGSEARMNVPSAAVGNWSWRLKNKALTTALAKKLLALTRIYGR